MGKAYMGNAISFLAQCNRKPLLVTSSHEVQSGAGLEPFDLTLVECVGKGDPL
jgi:hypothetical protein